MKQVWLEVFKRFFSWKIARRVLYSYCAMTAFGNHVGGIVCCKGTSMLPTIREGDIVFVERLSVAKNYIHTDDIVCIKSPTDSSVTICKRLVHKEFDIVAEEGDFFRIPKNFCYVLGDNADMSTDSREFGAIPFALVEDRVVFRLWPLRRFGSLSTHPFWKPEYK